MTFAVDENLRALGSLEDRVAEAWLALPGERVTESRAAAAFHAHTKTAFADALLGHQRLDLLRRGLADLDHVPLVRLKPDRTLCDVGTRIPDPGSLRHWLLCAR